MMQAQVQCVRWLQVEVQGRGEKGLYLVGIGGVCSARGKRAAKVLLREEEEERRRSARGWGARWGGEGSVHWVPRLNPPVSNPSHKFKVPQRKREETSWKSCGITWKVKSGERRRPGTI
ncbi:hypothetical protein MRB53_016687 [Persea americana]|uniref:Uncharacterized protein n=1 Tax=Persea americana TaxID=3435 RepID=A0ACC2M3L1_PERAE|nr:hypothetical protein MRB53_016687 [Persea americana]